MKDTLHFEKVYTQTVECDWLQKAHVRMDVLRTDLIHPVVSGNKWFKLKYYLEDARKQGFKTVATFGGPYSNHIIATAFACNVAGLQSIGIIRGERPPVLSPTLEQAAGHGMQLEFVSRALFNEKENIQQHFENVYWINEGGFGALGVAGAKEMLSFCENLPAYTHIICAVGTGTMLAGLAVAATKRQKLIGVSVMKGNLGLNDQVRSLLSHYTATKNFSIVHDYHFGGYAKHPPQLIGYINSIWQQHHLPTDIVYTSKTFYATEQMIRNETIPSGSHVLMIHSGGLQGNNSLPAKTLSF